MPSCWGHRRQRRRTGVHASLGWVRGEQYYVICGPTMRKLSAVERYLETTIGTTDVELWPVAQGNVSQILQNHYELSHVASRVTVVLDDGAVLRGG